MRERKVLTNCLVEGNEVLARSWRARAEALCASLLVQIALLAAMLLIPLLATGELPRLMWTTPVPPYGGTPKSGTPKQRTPTPLHRPPWKQNPGGVFYPTPNAPAIAAPEEDSGVPDTPGWMSSVLPGQPEGVIPWMPGGERQGPRPPLPETRSPAHSQQRIKQTEGVQQALLIHRIEPVYPPLAVQMRLEGTVRLRAVIARDGTVQALELLSGQALLAQAAMKAVTQWRYRPTLLNGQPVEVETYITVIFRLHG